MTACRSLLTLAGVSGMLALQAACASGPSVKGATTTADAPPSQAASTAATADPHLLALRRQLDAPWGARNDKDDQIHAPTPDWKGWKRVRFWGVQHFTGFRYGDDHHVLGVVFVQPLPPGAKNTSEVCARRFEAWGWPLVRDYDVQLSPSLTKHQQWRGKKMLVKSVDGYVDMGLERKFFSGAWAAYPATYPGACLIYAIAVPWKGHEAEAKRLRDRYVREGFRRMRPLTDEAPVRK